MSEELIERLKRLEEQHKYLENAFHKLGFKTDFITGELFRPQDTFALEFTYNEGTEWVQAKNIGELLNKLEQENLLTEDVIKQVSIYFIRNGGGQMLKIKLGKYRPIISNFILDHFALGEAGECIYHNKEKFFAVEK